jgi:hypothetical protein
MRPVGRDGSPLRVRSPERPVCAAVRNVQRRGRVAPGRAEWSPVNGRGALPVF